MQQILPVWNGMSAARKAIVLGATVAIFLAILGMSRLVTQPQMTLLYSGLDPAAAGEVVQSLQQRGAPFEVRGDSVFVSGDMRDELRMTLASEGLPSSSAQGYELLDNLTGFGTTSRMFDAAYLRAKEGELARTIVSSPEVSTARVHIAPGTDNPFRRDLSASASVHVSAKSGSIRKVHAQAIRHLVASAVSGLAPEDVAIVDSQGGLVSDDDRVSLASDQERSELLKDRVLRLIEARVGRGNAVVEVSIDTVNEREAITERRFDPESRFVISSDTEERSDQSEDEGSGNVTVASNLPDGDESASETRKSQSSETRERLNYEVSQTTREIIRAPGAIKRLTVAVLVNGTTEISPEGIETFVPIPDEELSTLRDLVASAVGYDDARGDVITLKSMPLEAPETLGSMPASEPWFAGKLDAMSIIQIGVLAVVVLVLGLFVIRPLLMTSRAVPQLPRADLEGDVPVLTGTIEPDDSDLPLPLAGNTSSPGELPGSEDAVEKLKALIEERRTETVEILRSWLDEPGAKDAP
ncbi:flagellar basal-body MS-ring/collar protein FliF [Marivita sp. GX14005]|uniref:flagellar basal-body MS-ring/collar protein FliF n=1 Tax=Marivita sp. GX14005 TaxID=2942276 RepID=UPI00201A1601|nr:flagellar basal-body MS-ring/collar protein FliF [Marivita sp. GX14005]MCL3881836.1 flagellar M-ring protein FliF [Marivita sp. GX14005]